MYGQHTKQLEEAYLKNVYQKLIDKRNELRESMDTAKVEGKSVAERNGWRASIEF